jgi:hypothetical protein
MTTPNSVAGVSTKFFHNGKMNQQKHQQLPSGKVVSRDFGPDGSLVMESHVYGLVDIGIEYVFSAGVKVQETYFYKTRLVGRRTYEKARANYPDMPEPDTSAEDWGAELLRAAANETRQHRSEANRHRPNPDKARDSDSFCHQMLQQGRTEDAVEWIKTKGRTLGERDRTGSKGLVERLSAAGCVEIWACEIDTYEDGTENTGHLVVKLPEAKTMRAKVLKMIDRLARETGYGGPFDDGQQYAYIMLD